MDDDATLSEERPVVKVIGPDLGITGDVEAGKQKAKNPRDRDLYQVCEAGADHDYPLADSV